MKAAKRIYTGDEPVWSMEWDEIECEIIEKHHSNKLMAFLNTQTNVGEDAGWFINDMIHNGQYTMMEIRSDRNHLAIVVIGPNKDKVRKLIESEIKEK